MHDYLAIKESFVLLKFTQLSTGKSQSKISFIVVRESMPGALGKYDGLLKNLQKVDEVSSSMYLGSTITREGSSTTKFKIRFSVASCNSTKGSSLLD